MKLYTLDNQFIKKVLYVPDNFTGIVEWSNGLKEWYVNGIQHRLDGPAYISAFGTKWWYVDGKLHRIDGPALEFVDGEKRWWIDGEEVTKEQCELLHSVMKLKGLI